MANAQGYADFKFKKVHSYPKWECNPLGFALILKTIKYHRQNFMKWE